MDKIIYVVTKTWVDHDGWAISSQQFMWATFDKETAYEVYKISEKNFSWSVHEVPLKDAT